MSLCQAVLYTRHEPVGEALDLGGHQATPGPLLHPAQAVHLPAVEVVDVEAGEKEVRVGPRDVPAVGEDGGWAGAGEVERDVPVQSGAPVQVRDEGPAVHQVAGHVLENCPELSLQVRLAQSHGLVAVTLRVVRLHLERGQKSELTFLDSIVLPEM